MESVGLEDCERLAVGGGLEVGSQGEWWGIFLPLFEKMQWIAAGGSIFSSQYPVPSTQYPVPSTQYPVPSTQYPLEIGLMGSGKRAVS